MKSMTGYGRGIEKNDNAELTFEIKSVNNRYLDVSVRLPRAYNFLEDAIKKEVGAHISRGKIDVYLSLKKEGGDASEVILNRPLIESYIKSAKELSDEFGLKNDLGVVSVMRFPEAVEVKVLEEDEEEVMKTVFSAMKTALSEYDAMREREGEKLKEDILTKLDRLEEIRREILVLTPESVKNYENRLLTKIREVLEKEEPDSARVLTEVAIFADKVAVDEELCRLDSHFKQFRSFLKSSEPVGKKLDFLVQEINREWNTTGSKCSEIEITRLVVEAKSELEKIREQIQNVE